MEIDNSPKKASKRKLPRRIGIADNRSKGPRSTIKDTVDLDELHPDWSDDQVDPPLHLINKDELLETRDSREQRTSFKQSGASALITLPPPSTVVPVWPQGGTSATITDQTSTSSSAVAHSPGQQRQSLQPNSATTATATATDKSPGMSSPPPSFNLSSGKPLVAPSQKTQSAFVGKLYAMLEDPEIVKTGLIHWSPDGTLFSCPNPTEFSKVVLPQFFKHNNWQSFVRQLNMYSFNKVGKAAWPFTENDTSFQTGTTDPMAWEFRHPLFRRDQPHLLAQIKRKSARGGQQDPTSPLEEESPVRPIAGWMREDQPPFRAASPVREILRSASVSRQSEKEIKPMSRGFWNEERNFASNQRLPPPPLQTSDRPPPSTTARFSIPTAYPESPYYPQPTPPVEVKALSSQIAALEEKVERLTSTLTTERIEHAKSSMDMMQSLLQMSTWVASNPDVRAMQESLSRQSNELHQKYERLLASDALTSLSTSRRHSERSVPIAYGHQSFPGTPLPPRHGGVHALHDPRPPSRHTHSPYPRQSPKPHYPQEVRPPTRPALPPPNTSRPMTLPATTTLEHAAVPYSNFPGTISTTATSTGEEASSGFEMTAREAGGGGSFSSSGWSGSGPSASAEEETKPKTGLSSLLN